MAKKSVASLQTGSKRLTKAIKMVKKPGSNSYSFVETILPPDLVSDWLSKKQNKLLFKKKATPDSSFFYFYIWEGLKTFLQKRMKKNQKKDYLIRKSLFYLDQD